MKLSVILSARALRLLLLGSLCLNVLLGAFLLTRALEPLRPPMAVPAARLVELAARRLPAADAETLRAAYRRKEAEIAASHGDYLSSLRAAGRLLAAPQVDVAALRETIMHAREKRIRSGDLAIDAFLEVAPQLSVDGRRRLVESIRAR